MAAKSSSLRVAASRKSLTSAGLGGKSYLDLATALDAQKAAEPKPVKKKINRKELRRKAAIERKKIIIRDHLRRELELSKKSQRIGEQAWEDMCKQIKITELREELQDWEQKSQTILERKDEKIEFLLNELEQAEELHRRQYAKQVQIIDYLTDCYRTVLKCMKTLYEQDASEVVHDFYHELNEAKDANDKIQLQCENIMHTTNLVFEQQLRTDFQIYQERSDDCVNREILNRYRLRDSIGNRMTLMQKQLVAFMASLRNPILDQRKFEEIETLMERQNHFVVEANRLNDVEFYCNRQIQMLSRELLGTELLGQRNINDLNLEMAYFLQVRKGIEKEMDANRQLTFDKMKIFCSESYDVVKKYTKLKKYGELLLSLSAQCRRLESLSEKIVPWGDFPELIHKEAVDQKPFKIKTLSTSDVLDMTEQKMTQDANKLKHFRRRQYLVNMHSIILEKEKNTLTAENAKYIEIIKSMSSATAFDELSQAISIQCVKPVKLPPCPLPSKGKRNKKLNFK